MSAAPVAFRIVKLLWRGARAVRKVRRGFKFGKEIAMAAQRLADSGDFRSDMSDREIAEQLERKGVGFGSSAVSRPTADQFLNGPNETRPEHFES